MDLNFENDTAPYIMVKFLPSNIKIHASFAPDKYFSLTSTCDFNLIKRCFLSIKENVNISYLKFQTVVTYQPF